MLALIDRYHTVVLIALLLSTAGVRWAAAMVLTLPVESDGAAYLAIADSLVRTGVPTDTFGNHAFYSIGYPAVIALVGLIMGISATTALVANLLLAALSGWLLWRLAQRLGLPNWAGLIAVAAHALWVPGIWNAAGIARENLSTPLLLALLLASLAILEARRGAVVTAGLIWGAGVLAGGSALLTAAAPLLAMIVAARGQWRSKVGAGALFGAGAAVVLAPWLIATTALLGTPTLNSNGGFNLYLGHNPAATGRFVSIADTPMGPQWHRLLAARGEAGASTTLGVLAVDHMIANPVETVALDATKLALFWTPNLPDSADMAANPMVAVLRWGEVIQYALILIFALIGLTAPFITRAQRWVIVTLIGSFWLLHAAAYIIPRYRDPVMAVLLVLAAAGCARLFATRQSSGATPDGG